MLPLQVTREQLEQRETVTLVHDALEAPLQLKLRPEMKDGMRLRLTNAKVKPAPSGARRVLILALQVEAPEAKKAPVDPDTLNEFPLFIAVTPEQVKAQEWVEVTDSALVKPLYFRLKPDIKNSTKLRFPDVELTPAPNGSKRVLAVHVQVTSYASRASHASYRVITSASEAPAGPAAKAAAEPAVKTAAEPVAKAAAEPVAKAPTKSAPPAKKAPAEPERKTVSFTPVTIKTTFQWCPDGQLRTGFKMGGTEDEGVIEVAPSELTVYKKSRAVGMAFGVIGSAIEGKGKLAATIRPNEIASFKKEEPKRNQIFYWIYLKAGQLLKVNLFGSRTEQYEDAMDQFLSQV